MFKLLQLKMYLTKNQALLVVAFLCAIVCSYVQCVPSLNYVSVGCYKDTGDRAIPTLEGKYPILDGHYSHRLNAIAKCAVAALKRKYRIFAVQHGGECFGGANAHKTFDKYGKSTACGNDGEGGVWANQVYLTKGYVSVGCYKDTGQDRAISTLEEKDPLLDGAYRLRANPTANCAVSAIRQGYDMFAVQNSGWCAASKTAPQRFNKHGPSNACRDGGEGGPWANEVYFIVPK